MSGRTNGGDLRLGLVAASGHTRTSPNRANHSAQRRVRDKNTKPATNVSRTRHRTLVSDHGLQRPATRLDVQECLHPWTVQLEGVGGSDRKDTLDPRGQTRQLTHAIGEPKDVTAVLARARVFHDIHFERSPNPTREKEAMHGKETDTIPRSTRGLPPARSPGAACPLPPRSLPSRCGGRSTCRTAQSLGTRVWTQKKSQKATQITEVVPRPDKAISSTCEPMHRDNATHAKPLSFPGSICTYTV